MRWRRSCCEKKGKDRVPRPGRTIHHFFKCLNNDRNGGLEEPREVERSDRVAIVERER